MVQKITNLVGVSAIPMADLSASFIENIKALNAPVSTSDRVIARRTISIATAGLFRIGVLKSPTPIKKFVLTFRKKDSKNLEVYQKTVVLAGLLILTTILELKNDKLFNAVEIAKVVLFEELVELGFDMLAIEDMITDAGKDIEAAA